MERRSLIQLGLTSFLAATPLRTFALEKKLLTIATMTGNDIINQITSAILQHAYAQINHQISVISMPNDRALQFANDGEVDGALYRVRNINSIFKNLVIVPVPLMMIEYSVFSTKYFVAINSWSDLSPYKIGYLRGIINIEENTLSMALEAAPTLQSVFKKMLLGRSDVVVCEKITGLSIIKELNLTNVKMLKTALPTFPIFHFVHKSHTDIVPRLTAVLNTMRQDRLLESIRSTAFEKLIQSPT
jgi:polar amino acid transport system substrate-binding protein